MTTTVTIITIIIMLSFTFLKFILFLDCSFSSALPIILFLILSHLSSPPSYLPPILFTPPLLFTFSPPLLFSSLFFPSSTLSHLSSNPSYLLFFPLPHFYSSSLSFLNSLSSLPLALYHSSAAVQLSVEEFEESKALINRMALCSWGQVSPVCALLGGVLGQEILKAVSG